MQNVIVELGQENFFCPVTGKQILSEETFTPSPATVFVLVDDSEQLEHGTPEQVQLWETFKESEEDAADAFKKFCESFEGDSIICFSLSSHELGGCQPNSSVHIAIDLAYCEEE
jgi:hypothetical protein